MGGRWGVGGRWCVGGGWAFGGDMEIFVKYGALAASLRYRRAINRLLHINTPIVVGPFGLAIC